MQHRDEGHDEQHDIAAGGDPANRCVTHEIDLDASLDDVWRAITDPAELGVWLGGEVDLEMRPAAVGRVVGDDGTGYAVLVTDVDDHRRLAWHWWAEDGMLSSVELTLESVDGHTRLRVIETPVGGDGAAMRACARRWERATVRLWRGVVSHAGGW